MTKEFNYIYEELVESDDDIYGIIAYSVYKRQKIERIQDFKKNHGRSPSDDELRQFNELSRSPSQIEFYQSEATVLTQNFIDHVLDKDLQEREVLFSAKVHSEISHIKPNHLLDIIKSAVGSLMFVLCTGLLYFILWSLSVSPQKVIEQVFDVTITSNSTLTLPKEKTE